MLHEAADLNLYALLLCVRRLELKATCAHAPQLHCRQAGQLCDAVGASVYWLWARACCFDIRV